MNQTSLQSQNGGPYESSVSLFNLDDFHFGRLDATSVQFHRTPSAAASSMLRNSNLSTWPALSTSTEVGTSCGLHQGKGAAQ